MSASAPDLSSSAADALCLRRLSQLTAATEGSSALSLHQWPAFADPSGVATARPAAALSLVPVADRQGEPAEDRPAVLGNARPPAADDRALLEQARGLAQALVEVIAGDRSLTQLVRWTTAEVYEQLHHRVRTLATCPRPATTSDSDSAAQRVPRRRRRPRVASLHVSTPLEGVAEVSARIDHGVRSTAIALRLEARGAGLRVPAGGMVRRVPEERWVCTAVTWA
jgi:hypothetical protein